MSGSTATINGSAGGLLQDAAGRNDILLGTLPGSVLAGLGTDTILGGGGSLAVYAANDANNIDVQGGSGALTVAMLFATGNATIAGGAAGETVTGGLGHVTLTQAGALTLHPGNGVVAIAANGRPITVWASDNSGYEVFTPTAGTTVTVAPTPDGYGHTLVTVGNTPPVTLGNGFETVGSAIAYLTGASATTFGNAIVPTPAAPVVNGLTPATDTGSSNSDGFTTDTQPTFTGTAIAGDEVLLLADGYTQIGASVANISGHWTIAAVSVLNGGAHSITAQALDVSGVESLVSTPYNVEIDTTGPITTTITGLDASGDSGLLGDNVTNVRHVVIDGTADPYDSIVLFDGATTIGGATADASGNWSVTSAAALTDGAHSLTAIATDLGGLTGAASAAYVVTVQTTPPPPPNGLMLDAGSDSGIVGDNLTDLATPTIDGAALPNDTVTVAVDGTNMGTVTTDGSGDWSFAIPTAMASGSHAITATDTDAVGNISSAATLDVTIEAGAAPPVIAGATPVNGGTINASDQTNAGTITVSGTAAAGSTIVVADNLVTLSGSVVANGSGAWSAPVVLAQGTNSITATVAADPAGNSSAASSPFVLDAFLVAPAVPTILGITAASDSGIQGDNRTDITAPTFTGTGAPGDLVTLTEIEYGSGAVQGTSVLATGTVGAGGTWFATGAPLDSPSTIIAVQSDFIGNTSSASSTYNLVIDAAPVAPLIELPGGNNTTNLRPTFSVINNDSGSTDTVAFADNGIANGSLSGFSSSAPYTPTSALFLGLNTITAVVTNQYGDVSSPASITVNVTGTPTTLALAAGSDSGILGDDLTNVTTPQFSGTATASTSITILDNAGTIGTATADVNGHWSFTPRTPLLQGAHTLTAIASLGNSATIASSPLIVTIKTIAAVPTISATVAGTGTITTGGVTNAGTIALSGTASPGATVAVQDGTLAIGSVVANSNGTWTDNVALVLGENTLTAHVSYDAAGNSSPASAAIVLDAFAAVPPAPTISGLAAGSDSGILGDGRTDISTPTLVGTGAAGDVVTLRDGATVAGIGTVAGNGTWSVAVTTPLAVGATAPVTATVTDQFGTISSPSAPYAVTIDPTLQAPTIVASGGNSATPQFVIHDPNASGDTDSLYIDGQLAGTHQNLTASVTIQPAGSLLPGLHTITAVASDAYGNLSNAGTLVMTLLPAAPTLDPLSDSGIAGDDLTNVSTPRIDGIAVANAAITILDNGGSIGATTANGAGSWSFTPTAPLAQGSNTLVAMVAVAAGTTLAAAPLTVTIESTAAVPVITAAVASNTGTVTLGAGPGAGGDLASTANVTLSGSAAAGAAVVVIDNGVTLAGSAVANGAGAWSEAVLLQPGRNTLAAAVSYDPAGNASAASAPLLVTAFVGLPGAPAITGLTPATTVAAPGTTTLGSPGGTTTITTPVLTGTGQAGDTVTLLLGSTVIGSGTVAAGGSWAVAVASPLGLGAHSISAEQSDPFGHVSPAAPGYTLTIDQFAAATLDPASQSGSSSSVTNRTTPRIDGIAAAGATVVVLDNGGTLGTTTASAAGLWSFTPATPLPAGSNTLLALVQLGTVGSVGSTVGSPAGSVATAPFVLTIQTSDAAPVLTLDPGSDSGLPGDDLTNDATPTLTGLAGPLSVVALADNATKLASVTAGSSGAWSYTPTSPLAAGNNLITGVATDIAGNVSAAGSLDLHIEIAVAPPAILAFTPNTGLVAANDDTSAAIITLQGTAAAGSNVVVLNNGSQIAEFPTATGQWTLAADPALGANSYTARIAADPAGNASAPSAPFVVTRLAAPATPAISGLAPASDSGVAGDGLTNVTTPTLLGTGVAADRVSLLNAGTVIGTGTVDPSGHWSVTATTPLAAGTHTLTATLTDAAADVSLASSPYRLTIDTAAPAAPAFALDPLSVNPVLGNTLTDSRTPLLDGTAGAFDLVSVRDGSTILGSTTTSAAGTWSLHAAVPLGLGAQTLTATATDAAGNLSAAGSLALTITNVPTAAPTITLAAASDSGKLGDNRTKVTRPQLVGSAAPGERVIIDVDTHAVGTVTASAGGLWSYTLTTALADGSHVLQASATDPVSGSVLISATDTLQIVTTAPARPVVQAVIGGVASSGTIVTTSADPQIIGTGPAAAIITLFNNGVILGTTTAAADGSWALSPAADLTTGSYAFTATATDDVGNVSPSSAVLEVAAQLSTPLQIDLDIPFINAATQSIQQTLGPNWYLGGPASVNYYSPGQTPPAATAGTAIGLAVTDADINTTTDVPDGTQIVANTALGAVTLVGGGNNQLVLSTGSNTTYFTSGGSGVYLGNVAPGAAGNNDVVMPDASGGNYVVDTGAGNDTILAGSGDDSIAAGSGNNLITLGSGNSLVTEAGNDTIVGGSGSEIINDALNTIAGAGSGVLMFGQNSTLSFVNGAGNATVIGGAAATVFGGAGSITTFGASGGGAYFAGQGGNNLLVSGTGTTTLAGGGGSGDLLIAANGSHNVLAGGSGNETLTGGQATGDNIYFSGTGTNVIVAGQGDDTVVMGAGTATVFGGAGTTLTFADVPGIVVAGTGHQTIIGGGASEAYGFSTAQPGGDTVIYSFDPAKDHVDLWGYSADDLNTALAAQTSNGSATSISMADGTRITFVGIEHINATSFSSN